MPTTRAATKALGESEQLDQFEKTSTDPSMDDNTSTQEDVEQQPNRQGGQEPKRKKSKKKPRKLKSITSIQDLDKQDSAKDLQTPEDKEDEDDEKHQISTPVEHVDALDDRTNDDTNAERAVGSEAVSEDEKPTMDEKIESLDNTEPSESHDIPFVEEAVPLDNDQMDAPKTSGQPDTNSNKEMLSEYENQEVTSPVSNKQELIVNEQQDSEKTLDPEHHVEVGSSTQESPILTESVHNESAETADTQKDAQADNNLPEEPSLPAEETTEPQPTTSKPVTSNQRSVSGKNSKSTQNITARRSTISHTKVLPSHIKSTGSANTTITTQKRQSMYASTSKVKDTKSTNGTEPPSKNADNLTSKRRPISMHFPTPPAPIKSSKAPTRPNFTLPGDAFSAKRKAELAEKLRKEKEELDRRRSFKARPMPSGMNRPASLYVRPASTSLTSQRTAKASQGQNSGSEKENVSRTGGLRRAGTVTGATSKRQTINTTTRIPSTAGTTTTAAKRQSTVVPASTSRRVSINPSSKPLTNRPAPSNPTTTSGSSNKPTHRVGSTSSNTTASSKPQPSTSNAAKKPAPVATNRSKSGVDDKKLKEETAKKARLEAAERSRLLSREWKEKQLRKMGTGAGTGVGVGAGAGKGKGRDGEKDKVDRVDQKELASASQHGEQGGEDGDGDGDEVEIGTKQDVEVVVPEVAVV